MITKMFTYGTLMTGLHNHKVIPKESIENIENATIDNVELYSFVGGGFPCMIDGNSKVFGELFTIKESSLNKVIRATDRLEGYNEGGPKKYNLYNRELKKVTLEDGSVVEAYVYMFNTDRDGLGSPIPEGDWKLWRTSK